MKRVGLVAFVILAVLGGLGAVTGIVCGFVALDRNQARSVENLRACGHEGAHVLLPDGRPGVVIQAQWAAFGSVWVRYHARAGTTATIR